jgi:hypothetical protein
MAQFRTSRTFDLVFLLAVAAFVWWAAIHRVALGDWVYFLRYDPSPETRQIAGHAGLSPLGQRLLFRTDPQFVSQQAITAACDIERLGCIDSKGRVFILDDPKQPDQAVVTAAHEMLHLAYRRLPQARKDELAPLIDQAIALNLPGINDELSNETTAADRRDEAHSLLGTEYKDLPSALEQYYAQYFTDRSKVVAAEAASEKESPDTP